MKRQNERKTQSIMIRSWFIVVMMISLFASRSGEAGVLTLTEDFTTKTHCDTTETTAWWDTTTGQLKYYPFQPTMSGSVDPGGYSHALDISGAYAYVADDIGSGLRVISISDPANPVLVGQCVTPNNAYGVDVVGNRAYIADNKQLVVADVTNPAAPVVIGATSTYSAGGARDVMVSGNYAYVAFGGYGLLVFDVMQSTIPIIAGVYDTPGNAQGVFVKGDVAYVADGASGLQILDISNPLAPALLGTFDTSGDASDVEVHGDHAFVADGIQGLAIIDVSTPAAPALVGNYGTSGLALGVNVSGDYGLVAENDFGLAMFDISDLTNPTLVWTLNPGGFFAARDVIIDGEHAFVAAGAGGLLAVNVAAPVVPAQELLSVGSLTGNIQVDGNYLYRYDGNKFEIRDVTDPRVPVYYGGSVALAGVNDYDIEGKYAYLVANNLGVVVLDISDIAAPTPVDTLTTTGNSPRAIAVDGDYGYVALYGQGIDVINVQDPENLVLVSNTGALPVLNEIAVCGDYLYAVGAGFHVFDITLPWSPVSAGSYAPPSETYNDLTLYGASAYIAGGANGLLGLSAYPPPPGLFYQQTMYALGIAVLGSRVFVGGLPYSGVLTEFDISNPTRPAWLGETTGVSGGDMSAWGDFVVTSSSGFVRAFDKLFYSDRNRAQSLNLNAEDVSIVAAILSTTQTGIVGWEMSADGGVNWDVVGGGSVVFSNPGNDLRWRASFYREALGIPTSVSDLTVNWICEEPVITSVVDIPNDQGRQVRVSWQGSAWDFLAWEVTQYAVYRRWDPSAGGASALAARAAEKWDPGLQAALPPGEWDFVTTIPATAEQNYAVVVPTMADSTITNGMYRSVFVVSAMTATLGTQYDSPPDSGYSVDNIAPAVPANFAIAYNTGSGNTLAWDESPDADFQYFRVYRSSDPNFTPSPATLVHATTSPGWVDPDNDGGAIYYKVTATDYSGNESDAATAGTMTAVGNPAAPLRFALYANVPNPFNPNTVIRYDVPEGGGVVSLRIYDVSGHLVRTLVTDMQTAGEKAAPWNGLDDAGRPVASGVYFYRMQAGSFAETRKMVLLK